MKKIFSMLLAACCLGSLCSCGADITYKNSDKYSVGGATVSGVKNLEIGWVDGSVTIATHEGEGVIFSETSNEPLKEADQLRYYLDGDKLYLQYARAGRVNLKNLEKKLTVLLPARTELSSLKIDAVSADVFCGKENGNFSCDRAEIDTVSGNVSVRLLAGGSKLKMATVSGDITAKMTGIFEELEANSTSGDVQISASAPHGFSVNTVSGDAELVFSGVPDRGTVDTVSGEILLSLPEGSSFTVSYSTVSGEIDCEHSGAIRSGKIEVGQGGSEFRMSSVSGDLKIGKAQP